MQIKLTRSAALSHKPAFFIEVDCRKIIDAHPQVDFSNDGCLSCPINEVGQHVTTYPSVPVLSQDRHPKLATMLNARPPLRAEGQRAYDFTFNFGKEIETGRCVWSLLEKRLLLLQTYSKLTWARGQILALACHL